MIPSKSESSLKNGIWFIHHDGSNTIQVWGSCLSGKEEIYLNNELVSEQRNIKLQSAYCFEDNNKQKYEVELKTLNLMNGSLKCIIKKDGAVLKTFRTKYVKGKYSFKRLLILIFAAAIFGVLSSIYELSDLFIIPFLVIALTVYFVTADSGKIAIEEAVGKK